MASSSTSWIPQGQHEVQIGPSLHKALKARKGGPPPQVKRTGPPEKDFYSFRYNFKPPSVDTTKPGSIEVSRGKDATTKNVVVEHPSTQRRQPGESHVYTGIENSAKELDCVLIYDEETGSYKLEKLESYIALTYDRKSTASLPASAAPSPQVDRDAEELLRLSLEDAEGEIDDDELPNHFSVPLRQEEEEEDGELEEVPPPPPPPAKPAKAPPAPKPRPAQAKPAPQRKPSKKAPPPPPPPADADEEEMEFGLPATKRARRSPPAAAALSFPGSSASWVPPPAPAPPPSAQLVLSDSDEDDWDEVPAVPTAAPDADAPQEIDMNEFEQTLEAEMEAEMEADEDADADEEEEEEDFLASVLPQVPDSAATPVRPMSMGQLAGYSEDEYSSSEDSDDD
ncbi:RNA polymerase II transcription elongation factor-domain-containing protein [Mycena epipterygia]|nr:RNA polymerase II transcription elongation factor-domain-containing protein [Mycena epipterygia]